MKIKDFFLLIRYKNLIIIALTQYLIRFCVILPFLKAINFELQLSELNFLFLVLSTMSIAAAGYAINDYFDIKVDMANHPESVVVGNSISRVGAMSINNVLNVIGVGLGFWVSYSVGVYKLGVIFILISGGLWFYSAIYKKQLFIGNIIVALFAAFVPLLTVVFELILLRKIVLPTDSPIVATAIGVMFVYVLGYSIFAFITTLCREIIKDIEDIEGDKENGRRTLPVVYGIKTSKSIILSLLSLTFLMIWFIYFKNFVGENNIKNIISLSYIFTFVILPIIFFSYKLFKATEKKHFHFVSNGIKLIMITGLLFSTLLWFLIE